MVSKSLFYFLKMPLTVETRGYMKASFMTKRSPLKRNLVEDMIELRRSFLILTTNYFPLRHDIDLASFHVTRRRYRRFCDKICNTTRL